MSFIHTKINNYFDSSYTHREEFVYRIGNIKLNEKNMRKLYKLLSDEEQQAYYKEKNVDKKIAILSEIDKVLCEEIEYQLFKQKSIEDFTHVKNLKDYKTQILKLEGRMIKKKLVFKEAIQQSKKQEFLGDKTEFLHSKCIKFLRSEFEYYTKLSEPILYAFEQENIDLTQEVQKVTKEYKKVRRMYKKINK